MLPSKRIAHLKKLRRDGLPSSEEDLREPSLPIHWYSVEFLDEPKPLNSDYAWSRFGDSLRNVLTGPEQGRQDRVQGYLTSWDEALAESTPMNRNEQLIWWVLLESVNYCEMAEYMSPVLRPFLFEGFAQLIKFGDIYSGLARVHMMTVDDLFKAPEHQEARQQRMEFLASEDGAPWLQKILERLPEGSQKLPVEWQLDLLIPAASMEPVHEGRLV